MDKDINSVFKKLMVLTPAQLAEKLSAYKNNAFVRTLKFLNDPSAGEPVISKNEIEINRSVPQLHLKDEDLFDWVYAANDERFALAA